MSLTAKIYSLISYKLLKSIEQSQKDPVSVQMNTWEELIKGGRETKFGRDHNFGSIQNIEQFKKNIPLREYDDFAPYITKLREGEDYVLWNQKVQWFAKSSGTSSAKSKFIPVTPDSLYKCHYRGIRELLATYVNDNPKSKIFDGQALTLGGSVNIDEKGIGSTYYGDLSAILLKNSNLLVETRRIPSKSIALTANFEDKVQKICKIAARNNVTSFSGVPSWNLILMNRILEYNNKTVLTDIWPNLELFMHGGINFDPYRSQYNKIIPGERMQYRENYNASEGYFGFQNDVNDNSMLLTLDNGVFYEFIEPSNLNNGGETLTIGEVSTGINYAVIISANNGLWRYIIGDTIIFTSTFPHKFIISGRTKLFINAFGEELMIGNAERALAECCTRHDAIADEYTVYPIFMEGETKGKHRWVIEFKKRPDNITAFKRDLDSILCSLNSDYEAKRANNTTMEMLELTEVSHGTFYEWLNRNNKLGGQNKVPRLSKDNVIGTQLLSIDEELKR